MNKGSDIMNKGVDFILEAQKLEKENKNEEAIQKYQLGVNYLKHELKYSKNNIFKTSLSSKIDEYEKHIETLKEKKDPMKEELGNEKNKQKIALEENVLTEKPNVKWEEVIGLEQAKEALQEAVILPVKHPRLFTGNRKPWSGILLYGPPGTGKSFLAKAAATETDCTFFSVSSSSIVSKWVGESEKIVKSLFELARERKPSIIFIDELDSLCNERGENESESSRRIKTELLVQMDGVGNDQKGVLVFGATNIPWKLDPAFRRRFQKKIYIGLATKEDRIKMLKECVKKESHILTEDDFKHLSEKTEGFTGADIKNVVQDSLMQTIRRINTATHFKKVIHKGESLFTSCSPGDPKALKMTMKDIEDDKLIGEPLCLDDFIRSLKIIKPTVSKKDLQCYIDFNQSFGQEKV